MNMIDVAHKTVHSYPGGSESLGPRIGMSPAVLRNKVNPNNTTHHLTLLEADEIMSVTGDHRMLHELAIQHGYVLERAGQASQAVDFLGSLLTADARSGEFKRVLQEAMSDGVITENEMKSIADANAGHMSATILLIQKLRAMAGCRERVL